jgi:hypothetical protein
MLIFRFDALVCTSAPNMSIWISSRAAAVRVMAFDSWRM